MVVERARSRVGMRTVYDLGKGGFDPKAPTPGSHCDCSGFVSWCISMSRNQGDKKKPWSKLFRWIETTAVFNDAANKQLVFVKLASPEPGCLVVYGDSNGHQGHIGVVTAVRSIRDFDVVDCSFGSYRREGDAILERNGSFFRGKGGIFVTLKEKLI